MSQDTDHEVPLSDQRGQDTSRIPRRPLHESLLRKIESSAVRVGIIGLGYVGLPLARAFGDREIAVLGFDLDTTKVARIDRGESYIGHISDATIRRMRQGGFEATVDFRRLDEPDVIIICVPTPLTDAREPDLTYIVNSAQAIAKRLRPGQLVVLESTTYPGTTREVVLPLLAAKGLKPVCSAACMNQKPPSRSSWTTRRCALPRASRSRPRCSPPASRCFVRHRAKAARAARIA